MLYVLAVETTDVDELGDAFDNLVDEVANWMNDNLPGNVVNVRPLSEVVSC